MHLADGLRRSLSRPRLQHQCESREVIERLGRWNVPDEQTKWGEESIQSGEHIPASTMALNPALKQLDCKPSWRIRRRRNGRCRSPRFDKHFAISGRPRSPASSSRYGRIEDVTIPGVDTPHSGARLRAGQPGALPDHAVFPWRRVREGRNRGERRILSQPRPCHPTHGAVDRLPTGARASASLRRSMMPWRRPCGPVRMPSTSAARRVRSSYAAKVQAGIWPLSPACACGRIRRVAIRYQVSAAAGGRLHPFVSVDRHAAHRMPRASRRSGVVLPDLLRRPMRPEGPARLANLRRGSLRPAASADHRRRIRHVARRSGSVCRAAETRGLRRATSAAAGMVHGFLQMRGLVPDAQTRPRKSHEP